MRLVNLARAALDAELLRYKAMAARQARRAGFGVAALVFVLGFLAFVEVAGWQLIRMFLESIYATLSMMGANIVIAIPFLVLALRSSSGRQERDAVEVRQQAVKGIQTSLAISTLVPTVGYFWRRRGRLRQLPASRQ